jgi:hypothetical protein
MDGNAAAANALFQKYLNGELSDELLRILRSWVQEEQACGPIRSEGDRIGVAAPQASEQLAPVRPVERRRLRRAGVVVGRIFLSPAAPRDLWESGHNGEIRRAARGYTSRHAKPRWLRSKSRRRD